MRRSEHLAHHDGAQQQLGGDADPETPMAERVADVMRKYPEAKIHLYGKSYHPGRKMGHVTRVRR